MKYNSQLHHRTSIRLKEYDYSQEGAYFITICASENKCIFGDILEGQMIFKEAGKVAHDEWLRTPDIRPNITLGEFIIMPNHMHGIIIIDPLVSDVQGNSRGVSHTPSAQKMDPFPLSNQPIFRSPSKTIGSIIRGYKSAVTRRINAINPPSIEQGVCDTPLPVWHRNYYEHIIRNASAFQMISEYIMNNVAKWEEDRFYKSFR